MGLGIFSFYCSLLIQSPPLLQARLNATEAGLIYGHLTTTTTFAIAKAGSMLTSVNPVIRQNLTIFQIESLIICLMITQLLLLLESQRVSVYKQTDGQTIKSHCSVTKIQSINHFYQSFQSIISIDIPSINQSFHQTPNRSGMAVMFSTRSILWSGYRAFKMCEARIKDRILRRHTDANVSCKLYQLGQRRPLQRLQNVRRSEREQESERARERKSKREQR